VSALLARSCVSCGGSSATLLADTARGKGGVKQGLRNIASDMWANIRGPVNISNARRRCKGS
jgi:hypothetical protein